jgi:hypothetical protein
MISFLTSEAGMTILGLLGGWWMRYMTERNKHFFAVLEAREKSMDAAAKRDPNGGTWMRRAIYALIAVSFLSVIAAGFMDVPVVLEQTASKGILFWKKSVTEFVTINGVFFPPEVRKAFLLLCAFYLGQGVK